MEIKWNEIDSKVQEVEKANGLSEHRDGFNKLTL